MGKMLLASWFFSSLQFRAHLAQRKREKKISIYFVMFGLYFVVKEKGFLSIFVWLKGIKNHICLLQ